jgi:hypothetical protein
MFGQGDIIITPSHLTLRQGQAVNSSVSVYAPTLALGTWIGCDTSSLRSSTLGRIVVAPTDRNAAVKAHGVQDPFPPDTRDHLLPH